jgi:hypothetical protein
MAKTKPPKFNVLSPDGFPISREPFKSQQEAEEAIPKWCERYEQQGYYSTSSRERIPVAELPQHLEIISDQPPEAALDASFKKLGHHVRLGWEKQEIDTDKNIATAQEAVKEQWQKEREEAKAKPAEPDTTKGKEIEPPEPDRD